MVDKTAFDGALDGQAYRRIGRPSPKYAKRAHFGQAPIADVGLYFSHRTRDWVGREKPGEYFAAFQEPTRRWSTSTSVGCGLGRNADLETLHRFPVVALCNAGILSERGGTV